MVQKRSGIVALIIFCMMVACLFLAVYVGEQARDWSPAARGWTLGALLLCLFLGAPALLVFPLRLQKRLGLVCPKCQKLILPISTVVIATSHCGYCGERVFDDPPAT